MSDEDLVAKAISGDTEAFRTLLARYEKPLLRYILYLIHDPDLADDALQETFIKTYRNLRGFRPHAKFSSWIYRIAHNAAMDSVKHVTLSLEDMNELAADDSNQVATSEQIDREITANDIEQCLDQLPMKYREVVILFYLQEKSYIEISDITHLSVSAVGVRINRAKHQLRTICKLRGVTQ